MRFEHPEFLRLLWALPVLALLLVWAEARRRRVGRALGDPASLTRLTGEAGGASRAVRAALLLAAIAAGVVGLARPQAGFRLVTTASRGADVVIAIDVSQSMAARDARPDRMAVARSEAEALIHALPGSPIGLIAFAGDARLESPLSTDGDGLASMVEGFTPGLVPRGGTDVAAASGLAARLLKRPGDRPRAIVLITDGENLEGDPGSAVAAAKSAGARIFAIGVGTTAGSTIPIVDSTGAIRGVKLDRSGTPVLTRLNEDLLTRLARQGGGRYVHGDGSGGAALSLVDPIRSGGSYVARGRSIRAYDERFHWLAALAGVLLLVERLLPYRRKGVAPAVLLLLLAPGLLGAGYEWGGKAGQGVRELREKRFEAARRSLRAGRRDFPLSAAVPYDEGLAFLGLGLSDSAASAYRQALTLQGERARAAAAYNLGNLAMKARRYAEARDLYRKSLEIDPRAPDAKRNLEEALRRLRESRPPPPRAAGGGGNADSTAGRNGAQPPPGARSQTGRENPPKPTATPRPGHEFTREEAERWLEALERERQGEERQPPQISPQESPNGRDW
jgi:Ca-activated chloride channel family protein